VGYLVMEKAVDDLLNAFASVTESDVMLCVVGDGNLKRPLMELAERLGLGTKCLFAGHQAHGRIVEWLSASDCLVLSSLTEGLPTIIPEAMMSRLPIVATAVGGIPEVVKDGVTGFLVPPGDREALASTITKVLRGVRGLEDVALRAEAYARSNLTWEFNAEQTLMAYQAVVRQSLAVTA
jgi:glycosyltransferase involved in cell wall biosynthesis